MRKSLILNKVDNNTHFRYNYYMEIKVIGCSKARAGLIKALATFSAQALGIWNDSNIIKIYSIPKLKKTRKAYGLVARMTHSEIRVLLDSRLDPEALVTVIAHEFTHVKQVIRQELFAYFTLKGKQGWIWNGKINKAAYANMPWEIEARNAEPYIANKLHRLIAKG